MSEDNITPFPQRAAADGEPPPNLFDNPTVPEAMSTLMDWTAWRIRLGDSPPSEWYRLHQLRDAILNLRPGGSDGDTIAVNLP